jgi:hypothetical protein
MTTKSRRNNCYIGSGGKNCRRTNSVERLKGQALYNCTIHVLVNEQLVGFLFPRKYNSPSGLVFA